MKYTLPQLERAQRLHEEGNTWEDVASQVGATSGTAIRKAVYRHEDKLGDGWQDESAPNVDTDIMPDFKDPEDVSWEDWCDALDEINDKHRALDPIQEKITVDLSGVSRPIAIAYMGDLHIGGGYTDHAALKGMVNYIKSTDGIYTALMGDEIEGFIPGAKTAETSDQMSASLKAQFSIFESLVTDLVDSGKLVSVSWGDHSGKWVESELGFNTLKSQIHDRTPYFTGRGLIRLLVGDARYFNLVNHSERFASQWSDTHAARRAHERFFPADVVATAHKHTPEWRTFYHYEQMQDAGLDVGGKAILLQTGSSKTGPDPYTIRRWKRGIFKVPTVVYWPDRRQKEVVESPRMAKALMDGVIRG